MFNPFLRYFLTTAHASFPVQYGSMKDKNDFIIQGIKISCKHKRSLYVFTKNSNDPKAKAHYIKYCDIQRKVTNGAKKQHYSSLIAKSNDKIRTTWNIIKRQGKYIQWNRFLPYL
jgi:ribosomal protein L33